MNILVIGSGGREHALAWKAAQSADVETVYVAPGNAGTEQEAGLQNVAIDTMDFSALADFAEHNGVGLTIVGPETPLVAGVVDYFQARGLRCFGPRKGAAQLEGSKAFTKDFLARHNIPTGAYATFTALQPALAYLREQGVPIVVKADGLAAGKGVIVAETLAQAEAAVTDMLAGNAFGAAGCRVVIEEFLAGEALSSWWTDNTYCPWRPARITNALASAIPGPTPAGWAPTLPLRWWMRRCTSASWSR